MSPLQEKIDWLIGLHEKTNHFYDEYLPYKFHLQMVAQVAEDFIHLLPKRTFVDSLSSIDTTARVIYLACYGHDSIEDTRASYNEIKMQFGFEIADIIYACTNEKGKTRAERANAKYYKGIRNTKGATFVKLCDRIANVQYSKMTKSRQFDMYRQENTHFTKSVKAEKYPEMLNYLNNLFL